MADKEKKAGGAEDSAKEGVLTGAAKAIGSAVGKVASLVKAKPEKEGLYKAEYIGSGTFNVTKPKRKTAKRRQSALKAPRRGARK